MNCKPGDLAVTHSAPMDNGLIVEVIALVPPEFGDSCWRVRSLGSPFHMTPTQLSHECWWPDAMLRPIRPQGDDARDETLDWLPVPQPEGVAA